MDRPTALEYAAALKVLRFTRAETRVGTETHANLSGAINTISKDAPQLARR